MTNLLYRRPVGGGQSKAALALLHTVDKKLDSGALLACHRVWRLSIVQTGQWIELFAPQIQPFSRGDQYLHARSLLQERRHQTSTLQ